MTRQGAPARSSQDIHKVIPFLTAPSAAFRTTSSLSFPDNYICSCNSAAACLWSTSRFSLPQWGAEVRAGRKAGLTSSFAMDQLLRLATAGWRRAEETGPAVVEARYAFMVVEQVPRTSNAPYRAQYGLSIACSW